MASTSLTLLLFLKFFCRNYEASSPESPLLTSDLTRDCKGQMFETCRVHMCYPVRVPEVQNHANFFCYILSSVVDCRHAVCEVNPPIVRCSPALNSKKCCHEILL